MWETVERLLSFTLEFYLFFRFLDFVAFLIFMFSGFPESSINTVPARLLDRVNQRVNIAVDRCKCIKEYRK